MTKRSTHQQQSLTSDLQELEHALSNKLNEAVKAIDLHHEQPKIPEWLWYFWHQIAEPKIDSVTKLVSDIGRKSMWVAVIFFLIGITTNVIGIAINILLPLLS